MNSKVIIIDDEPSIVKILVKVCQMNNCDTEYAYNGKEGLALYRKFLPDVVFLDIMMPDLNGLTVLKQIKKEEKKARVIIVTANPSSENAIKALKLGAYNFVTKPFKIDYIMNTLKQAIQTVEIERKNDELFNKIRTKNIELKKLIDFKKEFAMTLVHCLYNPIKSSSFSWEKLHQSALYNNSALLKRNIMRGLTANRHLLRIAENLRNSFDIEIKRNSEKKELVSMKQVISNVFAKTKNIAELLKINLTNSIVKPTGMVIGYQHKLEQILEQLVLNAIYFTPYGGNVNVSAKRTVKKEGNREFLYISITDTGIGITQNEFKKIFQKHYRINRSSPHGYNGNGVGLYIVRQLLAIHGGKIKVYSKLEKGSTFTVSLPLAIEKLNAENYTIQNKNSNALVIT